MCLTTVEASSSLKKITEFLLAVELSEKDTYVVHRNFQVKSMASPATDI